MSEKRFKFVKPLGFTNLLKKDVFIKDRENDYYIRFVEEVVDLLNEQQATISALKEENDILKQKLRKNYIANKQYEEMKRLQKENEQLRMKLKGDDYIMVSEMLSNLRKTGICDGCKNKDKPVEWYLERGFSITGQICDRYEPEV